MIGVAIQGNDAPSAIEQIVQAERAGIPAVWGTMGAAGGADVLATYAAAVGRTERVLFGTSIVQTWPRHPIAIAQQALAVHQLAPGRLRLGIGPAHEPAMRQTYGVDWHKPLTQLREYLTVLRALLHEGAVDFEGEHVTARTRFREPAPIPLMASALQPRSFEACGELADGAISWMCPKPYLLEQALPAIARGAERAGRATPPLVAHVPVVVSTDLEAVRALARDRLGNYGRVPFYLAMFERAGFGTAAEGYDDALLDGLVVHGTEEQVAAGLRSYLDDGAGEVIAHPVIDPADAEGSIARAFAAVARVSG